MKKLKKINMEDIIILAISIVAFFIGGFAINFFVSFLIVGVIDFILLILPRLKGRKKGNRKTSNSARKSTVKTTSKTGNKKPKKEKWKVILLVIFSIGIVILLGIILFFFIIIKNAPEFDPNKLYQQESTVIYDSEGRELARLGSEMREIITYDDMSEALIDAIVATEDARFFQHNGFDLPRFLVASAGQLLGKSNAGGASTITMQIVKNNFTSTEDSGWEGIKRKFTDIYMAIFKIEKNYTKQEILEFYANTYYLGNGASGVEQASKNYFGKSAKDLNIAEAAMIAGLFNAPVAYDPYNNMELAEQRRQNVLYLMNRHGYITDEEWKAAKAMTIDTLLANTSSSANAGEYQGFIDTVVEEVLDKTGYNPYTVPMEIYTSMDRSQQDHINKIMNGEDPTYKWENDQVQAGVSVINVHDGTITAIGAGRNREGERTLNLATQIKNQIGSTAKPLYDYGPGIEYQNWSTYTPFTDEVHSYSTGEVIRNWNNTYNGFMTMRVALRDSRNIPAIKAFQSNDKKKIKEFVTNLGLSPELENGIIHESHALGGYNGESPLTLSAAYAAFANGGYYIEPHSFTKIIYKESKEVYENKPVVRRAMSEETAYMIADMLITTGQTALGSYHNINNVTFGAKTGTANFDSATMKKYNLPSTAVADTWVTGINPDYSISVWYGYKQITSEYYNRISSGQNYRIFKAVAKGVFTEDKKWEIPDGVVEVELENECLTACLPSEFTPQNMRIKELFKKGTEPTEVSNRYDKLENVTNLNSTTQGSTLTLTWDAVKTPDAINIDYLNNYFKKLYASAEDQSKYLSERLNYNSSHIGTITYEIYRKDSSGNLQLVKTTPETKADLSISGVGGEVTYVVKTSYTIFKDNRSDGASLTVKLSEVPSLITSELNGDSTVTLHIGETYQEKVPSVLVYDNGLLVPSDQTDITIKGTVDTSTAGTYIITYEVVYKDYKNTLKRTVKVTAG